MRCTPMAVWCQHIHDYQKFEQAILTDVQFVHSNPVVHKAVVLYCFAIQFLLNNEEVTNKRQDAYRMTVTLAQQTCTFNNELIDWLNLSKQIADNGGKITADVLNPTNQQGWLKHAFVLSFAFLQMDEIDFTEAMKRTLVLGGDTDTNACIVGGLIGAAVGAEALPLKYRNKILTCDIENGSHPERP